MSDRPRFLCAACRGIVVSAQRIVDVAALEARHAQTCPGARLRHDETQPEPGRQRWGEERAAAYAARIEAARIAARMPKRRNDERTT